MPVKTPYLILCAILLSGCSSTYYMKKQQADDLDLPRYRPPAQTVNQNAHTKASQSDPSTPQAYFMIEPQQPIKIKPQRTLTELVEAYEQALLAVSKLHYDKVVSDFKHLAERFVNVGDTSRAAEALFWHGYCLEKLGRKDDAITVYDRIMQSHPKSKVGQQASLRKHGLQTK